MMGSPGLMPRRFFTSKVDVPPTSMNMSFSSITFRRSSSCSSWGGLLPTTPITSPIDVRIRTFCARRTWPHHPPMGRNLMNPSLVTPFTMNPTSSMWPAIMIRGSSALPFCLQMTLPKRSWVTVPKPRSCFFMIPAISDSCPGGPNASVSSFKSVWLASFRRPGVSSDAAGGVGSGGAAGDPPDVVMGTIRGGHLVLLDHAHRAVHLEDGRANLLHGRDAVLAQRAQEVIAGDPLPNEVRVQDLPPADEKGGDPLDHVLRLPAPAYGPRDAHVHHEEGPRRHEAAPEGRVGAGHGVLDGVGEKKEEEKIERGHLSDLTLPREAKPQEKRQVDEPRPKRDCQQRATARERHARYPGSA